MLNSKIGLVVVLTVALASLTGAQLCVSGQPRDERLDPSGDYHIADEALAQAVQRPYFDLDVRWSGTKRTMWGHVYLSGKFYRFKRVSLSDNHLTFTTASIRGVSFRFDGRFTRSGCFAKQFIDEQVLRGTLFKLSNGRVDEALDSDFTFFPGC